MKKKKPVKLGINHLYLYKQRHDLSSSHIRNHFQVTHQVAVAQPWVSTKSTISTMKAYSIALTALALLLSLLLSAWLNKAQAEGRPLAPPSSTSVPSKASTSQSFRGSQVDKKNPFKKVGSSFRRIPPSIPSPIQNKWLDRANSFKTSSTICRFPVINLGTLFFVPGASIH